MRRIVQSNCFLAFGIIIGIISIVMMSSFNAIYKKVLDNMLVIDPDSDIYDAYTEPEVPMNLDFYFFNVTNPEEIKKGAKPILVELGPYRYLEAVKKNGTFDHDAGTYIYRQSTTYFFDKANSNGSEEDEIMTLNPILLFIADKLDSVSPVYKAVAEIFFMRFTMWDDLFIKRKVSELLFHGYYDPLVELSGQLTGDPIKATGMFGYYYHVLGAELYDLDKIILNPIWRELDSMMSLFEIHTAKELLFEGYEFPEINVTTHNGTLNGTIYEVSCDLGCCIDIFEPNRFGYFYGQNGSNDGLYEVYTGEDGMDNYLFVKTWNGDDELHFWGYNGTGDDPYCNMINGTDGTQFPPGVMKDQLIQIFTTDLCRSIRLYFDKEILLYNKVTLYHFVLDSSLLKITSATECFCKDEFTCRDSMVNVKDCKKGAPLVLSTPHFYEGTNEDIYSVVGLNPDKEKHETYLDIEPTTGVVMRGAKRIQLNLPLKQYGSLSTFRHVPEVMFPILWADENAVIPEDDANTLNDALTVPYLIVYIVFGITLIISVIFIIIGAILRHRINKNIKAGLLMD